MRDGLQCSRPHSHKNHDLYIAKEQEVRAKGGAEAVKLFHKDSTLYEGTLATEVQFYVTGKNEIIQLESDENIRLWIEQQSQGGAAGLEGRW